MKQADEDWANIKMRFGGTGINHPPARHPPAPVLPSNLHGKSTLMNTKITPQEFFTAWKRVCETRKSRLLNEWTSRPNYTAEIFDVDGVVIKGLAQELKLDVYGGYYSLDAIFINEETDRVHCAPKNQNWFQNVRIAFEHENIFRSGLFQEVSHLLITRADLRVLVTYPDNEEDLSTELAKLARIVSESDLAKSDPALLLIIGDRINSNSDIRWRAYTHQQNQLLSLTTWMNF